MGAGGPGGIIGYPDYVEASHGDWLDHNDADSWSDDADHPSVYDTMVSMFQSNPYTNFIFTDPDTEFTGTNSAVNRVVRKAKSKNASGSWGAFLNLATQEMDRILNDVGVSTISTNAVSGGDSEYDAAETKASATVGITEDTDWEGFIDTVQTKLDSAGILNDIDLATLMTNVEADTSTAVQDAVTEAGNAANSSTISDLVTQFRNRAETGRNETVRNFAGGMASINAAQSSAFIIGRALIESQMDQDINQFSAEISQETYQQVIQGYLQSWSANLQGRLEGLITDKENRDQLMQSSIEAIIGIQSNRIGYEQALRQIHLQAFRAELESRLRAKIRNKANRDDMISRGSSTVSQLEQLYMNMEQEAARLRLQNVKTRTALNLDAEAKQLKVDVSDAEWDMSIFRKGVDFLAGPGGAAGTVPKEPSDAAQAVGGALTGVAAGAQMGGPWGAAAGAALGIGRAFLD